VKHQTVCGWQQRLISRGLWNTNHLLLQIPVFVRRPRKGVRWINFVHTHSSNSYTAPFSVIPCIFLQSSSCSVDTTCDITRWPSLVTSVLGLSIRAMRPGGEYSSTQRRVSFRSRHHPSGFLPLTAVCGESVVMYCTQHRCGQSVIVLLNNPSTPSCVADSHILSHCYMFQQSFVIMKEAIPFNRQLLKF